VVEPKNPFTLWWMLKIAVIIYGFWLLGNILLGGGDINDALQSTPAATESRQ